MKMPPNKVPSHAKWKTLRDKSGGKRGLAKVNIGKSIDNFHAAVEKAERSNDVAVASKAMDALEKNLNIYVAAISKKKEYNELVSTVKREMLSPLKAFGKGFDQMAAAQGKEINRVENNIRNVTAMAIKEGGKLKSEIEAMNKEMSGMARKFALEPPDPKDKKNIVKFIKAVDARLKVAAKGFKSLDDELNELVRENLNDHRDLIKKHNATLGKAKGAVKDIYSETKRARAYITELVNIVKKS